MIYPFKIVIFKSDVKLPEGNSHYLHYFGPSGFSLKAQTEPWLSTLHIANQRQGVDQNHCNKPRGIPVHSGEVSWLLYDINIYIYN